VPNTLLVPKALLPPKALPESAATLPNADAPNAGFGAAGCPKPPKPEADPEEGLLPNPANPPVVWAAPKDDWPNAELWPLLVPKAD
jgi:hypothetical protein